MSERVEVEGGQAYDIPAGAIDGYRPADSIELEVAIERPYPGEPPEVYRIAIRKGEAHTFRPAPNARNFSIRRLT